MLRSRPSWRLDRVAVVAAVVVVAVGLIVHVLPWLGAGLGDSHDGYNAAVWGLGARGGVEDPIGNRLGGIQPDGSKYTHHPPLLVWSLMPSTAIDDHWPLGLRLVPLLASLASMAILAALLLDAGVGRWAAAAGVLVAGSSAMFLTFGAMVDTPVFSFPFALAAVWAAQRCWQGRPPPTPVLVTVGAFAAMSGWQALLAAVVAAAVASMSRQPRSRKGALALAGGAATGLLVDLAWVWWVMGSLSNLVESGTWRGGNEFGFSLWLTRQRLFINDLFGPLVVFVMFAGTVSVLVSVLRGLRSRSASQSTEPPPLEPSPSESQADANDPASEGTGPLRRPNVAPLFLVLAVTVVGYALLFRQGSLIHNYWNYFAIGLVGVTATALVQTADELTRRFSPSARSLVLGLVAVLILFVSVVGLSTRSLSDLATRRGLDVVPLVERLPTARNPHSVVVTTIGGDPGKPWLDWSTRGRHDPRELADLANLPHSEPILLTLSYPVAASSWDGTAAKVNGVFALIPAGELERLVKP